MRKVILVIIGLFIYCYPLQAGIEFIEAQDTTVVKQKYRKERTRGVKVVKIPAVADTIYTIYVAPGVNTMVQVPYPILKLPNFGIDKPFYIDHLKDTNFFEIKPNKTRLKGIITNGHVICQNPSGKKFILNIEIEQVARKYSNQNVIFTDGTLKAGSTPKLLAAQLQEIQRKLEVYQGIISCFQFFEISRAVVAETLSYRQTSLELLNITRVHNQIFYNFKVLQEDDKYAIQKEGIKLSLSQYKRDFLFDSKSKSEIIKDAQNIYPYEDETGQKYFSVLFLVPDFEEKRFFSKLRINDDFVFQTKVDLTREIQERDVFYNPRRKRGL